MTIDHMLAACVLIPSAGVVAAGAMSATAPKAVQDGTPLGISLEFADGQKALFRTDDGVSLVMVGSTLPAAGRITAIVQREGRWTVTTNRNFVFKQD